MHVVQNFSQKIVYIANSVDALYTYIVYTAQQLTEGRITSQ